jgi:hypothetical protein
MAVCNQKKEVGGYIKAVKRKMSCDMKDVNASE